MNLVVFLTPLPNTTRSGYEKYLSPRHPELTIKTFGTRDEALKHAAWADIMMCFGPQVKTDFFKDTPKLMRLFIRSAPVPTASPTAPISARTSSSLRHAAYTACRCRRWRS